jgi:hypothetical protein
LLLLRPLWQLQRWLARFHWLQWLLRWQHWRPLWLLWLLWSLRLQLPGLRLVLSPLQSVEPVLLVCPKRLQLWPVRFALRWQLPLLYLRLQQQLSLQRPSRPLCRLSSIHWPSPLWSQRWQLLLLLQRPLWRQKRLLEFLRLQRWLLRWRRWPLLSLQLLLWSLSLPLPGLRLVFLQLLSIARVLLACPMRLPLSPVRFALRWLLRLPC